jgi:8-oxo-dGTP pyrophosphatase MutT (NUDIX family)
MREINRDIVSAMIFSKDGKLFQGKKHPQKGGVYSDFWHIPGGGIKKGEGMIGALVREIGEETGIYISKYPIELVDDSGKGESEKTIEGTGEKVLCRMRFYVYKVVISDKLANDIPINLGSDLETFRWAAPKDIKKEEITPPSRVLFEKLGYIK